MVRRPDSELQLEALLGDEGAPRRGDPRAGEATSRFLRGILEKKVYGERCPVCKKVYMPPRGACPTDGVPTRETC